MNDSASRTRRESLHELRRLQFWLRLVSRIVPSERHLPLIWAAIIGVVGALAAIGFQAVTHAVQWLLTGGVVGGYVETFRELPPWRRFAVPIVGGLSAGLLMTLASRMVRAKAVDYMEAVALGDGRLPLRSSLMRAASALCFIAGGASIGREGPLVQLAALVGSIAGRIRHMAPARLRLLVACGAAAGVAAAYNAPVAGALFVAEIIIGSFAMDSLGPLIIASVFSAVTMRLLSGDAPIYAYAGFELGEPWHLVFYALLGIVAAGGAHVFLWSLRTGRRLCRLVPGPGWLRLTLGGVALGLLAIQFPEVTGNGKSVLRDMLADTYNPSSVALLLGLKVLAVSLVFGAGAVGGVFTPSLFTGASIGLLLAAGIDFVVPSAGLEPTGFALVGMGAFLAAATQAPVMAIMMIFEMSLQYQIMVPLMVAAVTAYVTSRSLGSETLYAAVLQSGPRSVFDKPMGSVTAGEMMRSHPVSVPRTAKFRDVARQFLHTPSREVFVTDSENRFAGLVLFSDVQPYLRDPDLAEVVTANDILRDNVPVIDESLGLLDALAVFTRESHEALPIVTGKDRKLRGTLLRSDLLLAVSELARREHVRSEPV